MLTGYMSAPEAPAETRAVVGTGLAASLPLTQPQELMVKWGAKGKGQKEVGRIPRPD